MRTLLPREEIAYFCRGATHPSPPFHRIRSFRPKEELAKSRWRLVHRLQITRLHRLPIRTEPPKRTHLNGDLGPSASPKIPLSGELDWRWIPLAAGECPFHSGCVLHRADANCTVAMREAMTVAYMSADAVYDCRPAPGCPARQAEHPPTGVDAVNGSLRKSSCAQG